VNVAFGLKAHSGWAALVVLGMRGGELHVLDRRRVELVEDGDAHWAKQPYHAARRASPGDRRDVVKRGIQSARRVAVREMRAAIERAREAQCEVASCAVLMAEPMPDWSVDEILAVHFRMHKAEGVLFRSALAHAAARSGLRLVAVPEKLLEELAERALGSPSKTLRNRVASLGTSLGPPWGKDQKDAALAATIALQGRAKRAAFGV
jgi:hypothetical protein